MKTNNVNKANNFELIVFFYGVPFLISTAILVLIGGSITHITTGLRLEGFQARGIAVILLIICSYTIYSLLYKIPLQNQGIDSVKIIGKKLLKSKFLYFLFLTIICPWIFLPVLPKYWNTSAIILVIAICFITQRQFVNDIRKYIE